MRKKLTLLTILSLLNFTASMAQDHYKAKFINAFTRYMNWPESTKGGFFNIGVYGSFDLYKQISEETMGKSVGKQNVVAINIMKEDQLNIMNLHILVIGKKYCSEVFLQKITQLLRGRHTLIISETDGVAYGASIGFTTTGSSLGFTYNTDNIRRHGIMMSKQFQAMGREVN